MAIEADGIVVNFVQPVNIRAINIQGGKSGSVGAFELAYLTEDAADYVPVTKVWTGFFFFNDNIVNISQTLFSLSL